MLQEKLNDYLMFIESGEIYEKYPEAKSRTIMIRTVVLHKPTGDALRFLELATKTIQNAGFLFSWRMPDEKSHAEPLLSPPL